MSSRLRVTIMLWLAALGGPAALCGVALSSGVALDVHQPLLDTRAQGEGEVLVGDGEVTRVGAW